MKDLLFEFSERIGQWGIWHNGDRVGRIRFNGIAYVFFLRPECGCIHIIFDACSRKCRELNSLYGVQ